MKNDEQRLSAAWLTAALEAELGAVPDVRAAVLAAAPSVPPRAGLRRRGWRVATAALAAATTVAILLWPPAGVSTTPADREAQDPAPVERAVTATSVDALRALLADLRAVRLGYEHAYTRHASPAGVAMEINGWIEVPGVVVEAPLRALELLDRPPRPGRHGAVNFRLARCELLLSGERVLRGGFWFGEGGGVFVPELGMCAVSEASQQRVAALLPDLDALAAERFALVATVEQLRAVPRSVEHVVACGLGDADLAGFAALPGLRRVALDADGLGRAGVPFVRAALGDGAVRALAGWGGLEAVELAGARVSAAALRELSALPRLTSVMLRDCALTLHEAPPAKAEVVLRAERVELRGGSATGLETDGLARIAARHLSITGGGGGGVLALPEDGELPAGLEQLELAFVTLDLSALPSYAQLRRLALRGCGLSSETLVAIAATRLERLELSGCRGVDGAALRTALALPSLRAVALREQNAGRGTDVDLAVVLVEAAAGIEELDLTGSTCDRAVLDVLRQRTGLRVLRLGGTGLSDLDLDRLRRRLPSTLVLPEPASGGR